MSSLKYRRERRPDGSVEITSTSYPNGLRVCSTCEWCKVVDLTNNEDLSKILTCHLNKPPKVCGVYKWKWTESSDCSGRTEEFVSMIPQAELKDMDMKDMWVRENNCENYMPLGWHYEKEEKEYLDYLDRRDPVDPFGHLNGSFNKWILE